MFYSIIVPVYNRPDEVEELLESLTRQEGNVPFEVVIVEDVSARTCDAVVERYSSKLDLHYYARSNTGISASRNYGAEKSKGDYLVILDSDCIIPPHYFEAIEQELRTNPCDAFGGPDAASPSFSHIQKAVNYAMTSFFTTGGIRGGKKQMEKFHPRSFNMGIKKEVYADLGGFSNMLCGEDIDFSIRIFQQGYTVRLFPEAFVYHKRRTNMLKFFRQVFRFGAARIDLYKRHPSSLRVIHFLPTAFVVGTLFLLVSSLWCVYALIPLGVFCILVGIDASIKNKSLAVGCLSIATSFVQLFGYGIGFIIALLARL
ncbi:glycosyl transferase [Bacteroidia bacterium]|nr:glycosyl transferase [Bacteroidia bacterium]